MQEGLFDSSVLVKAGNTSPMRKVHPLHWEVGEHPRGQRQGILGQEAYINKPCYVFNSLTQAQSLRFFTN